MHVCGCGPQTIYILSTWDGKEVIGLLKGFPAVFPPEKRLFTAQGPLFSSLLLLNKVQNVLEFHVAVLILNCSRCSLQLQMNAVCVTLFDWLTDWNSTLGGPGNLWVWFPPCLALIPKWFVFGLDVWWSKWFRSGGEFLMSGSTIYTSLSLWDLPTAASLWSFAVLKLSLKWPTKVSHVMWTWVCVFTTKELHRK